MSALEVKALQYVQYIPEMSDDKLSVLIETFQELISSEEAQMGAAPTASKKARKIGSLKGQKLIADGYDIDECNDEIARMFGVDVE